MNVGARSYDSTLRLLIAVLISPNSVSLIALQQISTPVKSGSQPVREHRAESRASCENCGNTSDTLIVVAHGKQKAFCSIQCLERSLNSSASTKPFLSALNNRRRELIAAIEEKRTSKLITMIHREELGSEKPYITIEDSEEILHRVRAVPDDTPIDFVVHCPGGIIMPAEQIALAVKGHPSGVSVIIPHYAMSGATLIALAAKEIIMDPYSMLGPLDPQVGGYPSPSLIKLIQMKKTEYISDEMILLADIAAKSLRQMKSLIISLLWDRLGKDRAAELAEFFTGGYLTHDSPITAEHAQALELPVKIGISDDIHELVRLFKLTGEHHGSLYSVPCGR